MSKGSETLINPKCEPAGSSIESHGVTPKITGKPILNILPRSTVQIDTSHDPDNTLWLNSKIFECLGFSFDQGGFSLPFIEDNKWRTFSLGVKGKEGFSDFPEWKADSISVLRNVIILSVQYRKNDKISFFQLSTIANLFSLNTALKGQSINPMKPSADLFLPVRIIDTTLSEKVQNCLFWIYPNERFFHCLPPELAGRIKKELDYQVYESLVEIEIVPNTQLGATKSEVSPKENLKPPPEPVPCVYFTNLCESLPGLDYVNLYPNPATDKLNVDLVLQQARKIQFRVFDLGGRLISGNEAAQDFPAGGQYKHQLDISNLQVGLYMLVMTDEAGAKLTRRFVKN